MDEAQPHKNADSSSANCRHQEISSGQQDIEQIMDAYESQLLRYVAHTIGTGYGDTQDVVQEVFIRLNRQIQRNGLSSIKNLKCWLYKVAYNLAMDTGRSRRRLNRKRDALTEDPVFTASQNNTTRSPDENKGRQEMHELAMQELQQLPPEQRNVVLLKMIEGMTLREIGEATGLKIGTVNYRLTQGLKKLAERLKAFGAIE